MQQCRVSTFSTGETGTGVGQYLNEACFNSAPSPLPALSIPPLDDDSPQTSNGMHVIWYVSSAGNKSDSVLPLIEPFLSLVYRFSGCAVATQQRGNFSWLSSRMKTSPNPRLPPPRRACTPAPLAATVVPPYARRGVEAGTASTCFT